MSIAAEWEAEYRNAEKLCPYPNTNAIKAARWDEFKKQPAPTMSMALSHDDLKAFIKKREEEHHTKVKAEIAKWRDNYHKITGEVTNRFRKALAKEYLKANVSDDKEALVWDKAWEHGHANGYASVEFYYQDFAEIAN